MPMRAAWRESIGKVTPCCKYFTRACANGNAPVQQVSANHRLMKPVMNRYSARVLHDALIHTIHPSACRLHKPASARYQPHKKNGLVQGALLPAQHPFLPPRRAFCRGNPCVAPIYSPSLCAVRSRAREGEGEFFVPAPCGLLPAGVRNEKKGAHKCAVP